MPTSSEGIERPIVAVEGLGKEYFLGARETAYKTLREAIMQAFRNPWRRRQTAETIWALRDISFEVAPGEVLGIIGPNGAGKSTLLKVISRITEPTTGSVLLYGRVGSLLEIGTGFHPELSGRENVFLSGTILGMRRREVAHKFDAIVAFAEVERFLDTPIKRYSSGMYLRLAFAVAAHLNPEILLVDEVLAVGDAAFQKKCLGKMGDVAREGRTVLFVSHNMAAVEALCSRCLLIQGGRIEADGTPQAVIEHYLAGIAVAPAAQHSLTQHPGRRGGSRSYMRELPLMSNGEVASTVRIGESLAVRVTFDTEGNRFSPVLGVMVKSAQGVPLFGINNRIVPGYEFSEVTSRAAITCHFEHVPLMPGTYFVDLYLGDRYQDHDVVIDAAAFEVTSADVFGSGRLPPPGAGPLVQAAKWELDTDD